MATWVLTGSREHYEATAARGHSLMPADAVKDDLEWIRKWPPEHWKLAFQGQLRAGSAADATVLMEAMRERAAAGVGR